MVLWPCGLDPVVTVWKCFEDALKKSYGDFMARGFIDMALSLDGNSKP